MEGRQGAGHGPATVDFGAFLRTGRLVARRASVELKFNPYHDPRNGQFTFAPGGGSAAEIGRINRGWEGPRGRGATPARKPAAKRPMSPGFRVNGRVSGGGATSSWGGGGFSGGGGGSFGGGGASSTEVWPAKQPATGRGGAASAATPVKPKPEPPSKRRAARPAAKAKVRAGTVKRPKNPAAASAPAAAAAVGGAAAVSSAAAVSAALTTGASLTGAASAGALPAGWKAVTSNGYDFKIDHINRTREAEGWLREEPAQPRSKRNQRRAGGNERLADDEGGHFIARRFGGPREAFNHFAQNGGFNRGAYRGLEDKWATALRQGKRVWVRVTPRYEGTSMRPSELVVEYKIDGIAKLVRFSNGSPR